MKISKSHNSTPLIVILILSCLLNACTSFQPLGSNSPEFLAKTLEVGDRVEVRTNYGIEREFIIEEITAQGISGNEITANFDEIAQVKVKRVDQEKVKNITLVVVAVPLIVLALGMMTLGGVGAVGFPGP